MKFVKGSEWRKWDLHIHTPYSELNQNFGDDFQEYAKQLFTKAVEKNIAVIGITDYFSIEGYTELKKLVDDKETFKALLGNDLFDKAEKILLLPNIELRDSHYITDAKVNYHIIFSNEVPIKDIDEHFFRSIKFISESAPSEPSQGSLLTRENLEDFGEQLKLEHAPFQAQTNIFAGMNNASVLLKDVIETLDSQRFKDKYLLVIPVDEDIANISWNGQGHQIRKTYYQQAHMFFSSNKKTRDFGLGKHNDTFDDFIQEFKTLKPCIHSSDAHDYDSMFEPDEKRYTWIKANPTFQGLRQLLFEPEERIYIGEQPSQLLKVKQNSTKYIDRVQIYRTPQARTKDIWFDNDIPLNSGLTAIIGNKGGGKSALSDSIGRAGNSFSHKSYSFLDSERFLNKKANLGEQFEVRLKWANGTNTKSLLIRPPDSTSPEKVKYIPQKYLEDICTELSGDNKSKFYAELMEVIYSHIEDADRLGQPDLQRLIDYKTAETNDAIANQQETLGTINWEIVDYEKRLKLENKKKFDELLKQKKEELNAHKKIMPQKVLKPKSESKITKKTAGIQKKLKELEDNFNDIELKIKSKKLENTNVTLTITQGSKLIQSIKNLQGNIESFYKDQSVKAKELGFDITQLVIFSANTKPLETKLEKCIIQQNSIRCELDKDQEKSLVSKQHLLKKQIELLAKKLDEPNKLYKEYLSKEKQWSEFQKTIEGDKDDVNSLKGLEEQIKALKNIPKIITGLIKERLQTSNEIFEQKLKLLKNYQELYQPVQDFIEVYHRDDNETLQFQASIATIKFKEKFLNMIDQGKAGTYCGKQKGSEYLQQLLDQNEFNSLEQVESFQNQIVESIQFDCRDVNSKIKIDVDSQLRQDFAPDDLYDFIFGLDWLEPQFELQWMSKPLNQLSPGERGTLLLIFFLLIDKKDIPLIIDQPEENLDNESIAKILVPAIKDAKSRRQVIIVTHNPNLAVVCDADQVIYAAHNKSDKNQITYISGSLEDKEIVQKIIDVLEGTKPAFQKRDSKYGILN